MIITLIAAIDRKSGIGKDGRLLWHLPADLKRFRKITKGHTVVMGLNTYESIGKPLPNRNNIVLSRQNISIDGVTVVHSLDEFKEVGPQEKDTEVFIIGGAQIYSLFLPLAHGLIITDVEGDFSADTFFPDIHPEDWYLYNAELGLRDGANPYNYTFKNYIRLKKAY